MMAYAIIEFGLSSQEAGRLTFPFFRELDKKLTNKEERQSALLRLQTYYLVPHGKFKEEINNPAKLWSIGNEKPITVKIPTKEEQREIGKRLGESFTIGK